MLKLKVTNVGGCDGFILPKEAVARLGVKRGDTLYLTEAPDSSYRVTPFDPDFERQMEIAEKSCTVIGTR